MTPRRIDSTRWWELALALAIAVSAPQAIAGQPSASEQPAEAPLAAPSGELEEAIELLLRLEGATISVDYETQPLREVIDDLKARLPVRLHVDWEALDSMGVEPASGVMLEVQSASCATVLSGLAMALAQRATRPVVEAFGGQVVLTSPRGAAQYRFTAAYDLRDLIRSGRAIENLGGAREEGDEPRPAVEKAAQRAPPANPPPGSPASDHPQQTQPSDGEPGHQPTNPESAPDPRDPRNSRIPPNARGRQARQAAQQQRELLEAIAALPRPSNGERLMMLLTDHVDPEAWIKFGGDRADYSERDGVVIVTAPASTHRRLSGVLSQLRAADPSAVAVEAMVIDLPASTLSRLSARHEPASAGFARALRNAPDAVALWQTRGIAALGHSLAVDSSTIAAAGSAGGTLQFAVTPSMEETTGRLLLKIHAEFAVGGDRRSVDTTVDVPATPASSGAVIELPPGASATDGRAGSMARLLIIMPRRM